MFHLITRGQRERSPRYQKLRTRVAHIRCNRRLQPRRSAMERSRSGGTAFMITVASVPGKYAEVEKRRSYPWTNKFRLVCFLMRQTNSHIFTGDSLKGLWACTKASIFLHHSSSYKYLPIRRKRRIIHPI